ncbi:hypothetical protein JXL83_00675 [candidate division WOR-3 bacterium]|nr:hypothetical protein [candidate division WOR-3 bacterium]
MKVVFIHGRSQENKDPEKLKITWIKALKNGLKKTGLSLPKDVLFEFPYYGKILEKHTLRKTVLSRRENLLIKEILFEMAELSGLIDFVNTEEPRDDIQQKSIFASETVQKLLRLFERNVEISSLMLDIFTRDVAAYLSVRKLRDEIDNFVMEIIDSDTKTVIGHSLGSVIGYEALRKKGKNHRSISLFVTVGSPLGLSSIKKCLSKPLKMPDCVEKWLNVYDERDFIALKKLDKYVFPITPEIMNLSEVKNDSGNHHGIEEYLNDKTVAEQIFKSLV